MTRVLPLSRRFPRGLEVMVWDDIDDERYAGRMGRVTGTLPAVRPHYPHGIVVVSLQWPALVMWAPRAFGRTPPRRVHFSPRQLHRRTS